MTAAIDAEPRDLGAVTKPKRREQYAREAERMQAIYDLTDVI